MAKTIWIQAKLSSCDFSSGHLEMQLVCGHHRAIGDKVCEEPVYAANLDSLICFTAGMINSSLNALVEIRDGWAPLGRITSKFELRHGVGIQRIVNDFSRDGDIECVTSREDAEKLCLLGQRFPNCNFTLQQIAEANSFDIDRMSSRSLRALKLAIENRIKHTTIEMNQLILDANLKTLVLAGKNEKKGR